MSTDDLIERAMDARANNGNNNHQIETNQGSGLIPPDNPPITQRSNDNQNMMYPPIFQQMLLENDNGINIGQIFRAIWFRRGLFATIALVLATILVVGNHIIFPDRYEAVASVRVKAFGIDDAKETSKAFEIIPSEVLSNRVLEQVITELDLTKRETIPLIESALLSAGIKPNKRGEDPSIILRWLKKEVQITQERVGETKTALFKIKLTDSNPEKATSIVNSIVDTYIETRHSLDSQDSAEAVIFLSGKIQIAEKIMRTAAQKLTDFQIRNAAYLVPITALDRNIETLREEHTTSVVRLEQIAELKKRLNASLAQEERYVITSVGTGRASSIDGELHILKVRLASATAEYTPNHPTVIHLTDKVGNLQQTIHATSRQGQSGRSKTSNPQYVSLRRELDTIESEQIVLKKRVPHVQQKIVDVSDRIVKTLATQRNLKSVEGEWDKAYDDYRTMNNEYISYQTRAEADASSVGKDLKVLDYANVPTLSASAPRRTLMMLAILLAIGVSLVITMITSRTTKWEIPESGEIKQVGIGQRILTNTLGFTWFIALIGYIIITPYI